MGRKHQSGPIANPKWVATFGAMKSMILGCAGLLALTNVQLLAVETPVLQTESGIPLDAPWKVAVFQFAKSNLQHSAWGLAHAERDFQLATTLAEQEKLTVDLDVLFAAAFLHDMGVFEPYPKEGVDHTERAAQVAGATLQPAGFPMEKFPQVQTAMRSHMFYSAVNDSAEARVLHDADTLDFLGMIGVTRILSVTSRHRWANTLPDAIATLEKFKRELPGKLVTDSAKKQAAARISEMEQFLSALKAETHAGRAL